jgi:LmbE family N-acetylglucosaminyl deacetylase
MISNDIVIEKAAEGLPHAGKVLAVIAPHSDDFSIAVAGTTYKLINEGYTGYFIRVTNDEMDSYDSSTGETILANERDMQNVARILGITKVYDLNYRNHYLDEVPPTEIRSRFIFLFRLLKIDTVLSFDPWGHYEENPDHYITAQAVEAACWMAAGHLDYPEHFDAGLTPYSVKEKYYWARGPQLINRVVDIGHVIETKMKAIQANKTQVLNMVLGLRDRLARENLTLSWFSAGTDIMVKEYAELVFRPANQHIGKKYELDYAEEFHYIGPGENSLNMPNTHIERYISNNACPVE